jgi:hypothetical protein
VNVKSKDGYMFDACENLAPVKGGSCQTQTAPALQRLWGTHHANQCPSLGTIAARSVEALPSAVGVRVQYGGGDGCGGGDRPKRNVTIDVACADRAAPRVLGVEETTPCNYHARVEAREGCPWECLRDGVTGAVCGGAERGACVAIAAATGADGGGGARCECTPPRAGPTCELEAAPPAAFGLGGGTMDHTLLVGACSLVVLASCAVRLLRGRTALLACAALLALAAAPSRMFSAASLGALPAFRTMDGLREQRPSAPASNVRVIFSAAGDVPLRRHAILLTGAIRDLTESFPTLLRLLRATHGGFDVYAVLSSSRGGWSNADRDEEEDEAALEWLRALPDFDPRVALQLLAYDTTPTLGPLTAELSALYPGYNTSLYDGTKMQNPSINLLVELKKMLNVWSYVQERCGAVGVRRSARGRHCYDMIVRARPDMRWADGGGSQAPVFAQGLDLNRLWGAWDDGASPFHLAAPWINGSALPGIYYTLPPPANTPPLNLAGAACLHSGNPRAEPPAGQGPFAFLPFFSPAFGNGWGGPNDMFMFGPWETMRYVFPRAPLVEPLLRAGVILHPEKMLRCGMEEMLRQASGERGKADPIPVLEQVILDIHFCRHYGMDTSLCF